MVFVVGFDVFHSGNWRAALMWKELEPAQQKNKDLKRL
jgi:hypothetical protein